MLCPEGFYATSCTVSHVFRFNGPGLSKFSYVFIDEAGIATEPQTLVGFVGNLDKNGLLVLAGDHKQLRPVVTSPLIQAFGQKKPALGTIIKINHQLFLVQKITSTL